MSQLMELTVRDGTMPAITFGTGSKTLAVIAGMSMTGIRGLEYSAPNAYRLFAEEYTVYLFERRDDLPQGYSVADMAEDIACAMNLLELKNADVFGVSQGGMIAQLLAARHPELVHSLVLGSTMCCENPVSVETVGTWLELARQQKIREVNHDFYARVYSPAFCEKNRRALAYLEKTGTPEQCARFAVMAQAVLEFDSTAELGKIQCPVLVMGDRSDRVLSGEASELLAEKLNCQLYMYDGFGHAVYDEAPDYRQRMLDFFHEQI